MQADFLQGDGNLAPVFSASSRGVCPMCSITHRLPAIYICRWLDLREEGDSRSPFLNAHAKTEFNPDLIAGFTVLVHCTVPQTMHAWSDIWAFCHLISEPTVGHRISAALSLQHCNFFYVLARFSEVGGYHMLEAVRCDV